MHEVVSLAESDMSDSNSDSDEQNVTRFRRRKEVPVPLQGCEEWPRQLEFSLRYLFSKNGETYRAG
jgi:hypothetical protein